MNPIRWGYHFAWAKDQRALLTATTATVGHSSGFYPAPPWLETTASHAPRDGRRVRCCSTSFSFGEVLP